MTQSKQIVDPPPVHPPGGLPAPAPWWMWPHLLSLDAPAVAVGWQAWWAQTQGAPLHWFHHAILGLCVWMIYLADRLADGLRASPAEWGTARHAFSRDHRGLCGALLGAAVVASAALAFGCLSAREFAGGTGLLAVAGAYFWRIHGRAAWPIGVPKEAAVGSLFSAGAGYFVICAAGGLTPLLAVRAILFGALCFLNCALITRWERTLRDRRNRTSLLNACPWLTERLGFGAAGLAAVAMAGGAALGRPGAFAPVALGAAGLWGLDLARNHVSAGALRVLADVALLAPWLFLR